MHGEPQQWVGPYLHLLSPTLHRYPLQQPTLGPFQVLGRLGLVPMMVDQARRPGMQREWRRGRTLPVVEPVGLLSGMRIE